MDDPEEGVLQWILAAREAAGVLGRQYSVDPNEIDVQAIVLELRSTTDSTLLAKEPWTAFHGWRSSLALGGTLLRMPRQRFLSRTSAG